MAYRWKMRLGFKTFVTKSALKCLYIVSQVDTSTVTVMLKGSSKSHADRFHEHRNVEVGERLAIAKRCFYMLCKVNVFESPM